MTHRHQTSWLKSGCLFTAWLLILNSVQLFKEVKFQNTYSKIYGPRVRKKEGDGGWELSKRGIERRQRVQVVLHVWYLTVFCCVATPEEVDEEADKTFLQFYVSTPAGASLSQVLRDPEKRRKLGKLPHSRDFSIWNIVEAEICCH